MQEQQDNRTHESIMLSLASTSLTIQIIELALLIFEFISNLYTLQ